jgi:hypothetical protein
MSLSVNSRLPYSSETLSVAILPLLLSLNFPGGTVRGVAARWRPCMHTTVPCLCFPMLEELVSTQFRRGEGWGTGRDSNGGDLCAAKSQRMAVELWKCAEPALVTRGFRRHPSTVERAPLHLVPISITQSICSTHYPDQPLKPRVTSAGSAHREAKKCKASQLDAVIRFSQSTGLHQF